MEELLFQAYLLGFSSGKW